METTIYNQKGTKSGTLDLPKNIFGLAWNADLVHQVAVGMQANARAGTAHTKNRGEVRGGGKKPWQQKGTGRARHGSSRSPIWVGGGITHGPRSEKDYSQKLNKKMKTKALFVVLSKKYKEGEIFFTDTLEVKDAKTKAARSVVDALKLNKKALIASPKASYTNVARAYRNLKYVDVASVEELNVVDILNHKFLVLGDAQAAIAILSKKNVAKKAAEKSVKAK